MVRESYVLQVEMVLRAGLVTADTRNEHANEMGFLRYTPEQDTAKQQRLIERASTDSLHGQSLLVEFLVVGSGVLAKRKQIDGKWMRQLITIRCNPIEIFKF